MLATQNWIFKPFAELTPYELYAVIRLRTKVFVVVQNCVFKYVDNKAHPEYNLLLRDNEQLSE